MGYRLGEPIERIYEYRVNGWNYLDRRHVILRSGVSDRYLITLQNDCRGLMSNEIIAYTTTVNQLTVFDKLLVRDGMSVLEQCWIRSLHKLQPTQA